MTSASLTVVDASAIAALLFDESEAEAVANRIAGSRLVAPRLLSYEISSVCLKKLKLHPRQRRSILHAFSLYPAMGIELLEVRFLETVELARGRGLTVYDAAYLWLAGALQAELVTLDRRLERAYQRSGTRRA